MSEKVVIALLFAVWWIGNALYAVDAQNLLQSTKTEYFLLDLVLVQISFGLLASHILVLISEKKDASTLSSSDVRQFKIRDLSVPFVLAGIMNYTGTTLTNRSHQIIGSTSTLVWKLAEPFSAVALKKIILGENTSAWAMTGVIIAVSGVLLFTSKGKTLNITVSTPIIISNIVFPLRNVFVKLDQKQLSSTGVQRSSLVTYRLLMLISFPFAFAFNWWAILSRGNGLFSFSIQIIYRCIWNAILFNSYQLASVSLLTRLDPVTHSVCNTLKRFSAILASILFRRELFLLGWVRIQALFLTFGGFLLYSVCTQKKGISQLYNRKFIHILALSSWFLVLINLLHENGTYLSAFLDSP